MRRYQGFVLVAVVALAPGASPRLALAASTSEADALVDKAIELRRDGDDQGALPLLLQAYGMGHGPRAGGQLGFCEQALGRWAEADEYLTNTLKAERDPWVKKNRRTLEDALAIVKSHVARLEVDGEPAGAEVWVNGTLVGKLPLSAPVRVASGDAEVEVRVPGFLRETKSMHLEPGQYQRVILRARKGEPAPAPPEPTPVAPAAKPPLAAPASSTTAAVVTADDKRPDAAASPSALTPRRLALKWVALGLGAAALGVGIVGAITNAKGVTDFNRTCSVLDGVAVTIDGQPDAGCRDQKSSYETATKISVGGFAAAGLLMATGLVLWLTEPTARAKETAGLACRPSLTDHGGAALGCALRF